MIRTALFVEVSPNTIVDKQIAAFGNFLYMSGWRQNWGGLPMDIRPTSMMHGKLMVDIWFFQPEVLLRVGKPM